MRAVSNSERSSSQHARAILAKTNAGSTALKYPKGNTIFAQGDAADSVFFIQRGRIKLAVASEKGKAAVLAILGPGDFLGEASLNGSVIRMTTAVALTDCTIMRYEKAAMMRALRERPEVCAIFISYLLARNARIEEDLVDHLFHSSERRLARVLLLLANFGTDSQTEAIVPNVSQEILAEMVGTTRSRISFFMNKFRRLGFIDYNGGLEVHQSLLKVIQRD